MHEDTVVMTDEAVSYQLAEVDNLIEAKMVCCSVSELREAFHYLMNTGGKRIRPLLCLLTCDALGGNYVEATGFAASVEILHNALLIHDDIMDGDRIRRDVETVWAKFGYSAAINLADFMIALAYKCIIDSPLKDHVKVSLANMFSTAYLRTAEGQALDARYKVENRFNVDTYMHIATLKTGYYLVLGMAGGALIAGANEETLKVIWDLGAKVGPAFQIRDDILDLSTGKGRGGEIGCDIREGKPSILFAHCLSKSTVTEARRLVSIMRKKREETSHEDINEVIRLYSKHASIKFASDYASDLIKEAEEIVSSRLHSKLIPFVRHLLLRER